MTGTRLSQDTAPEAERMQVELWRSMTPLEKARLTGDLSRGAQELALAGIRSRHPHAGAREQFLRLAQLILGGPLTRRVYPDADELLGP